MTSKIELTIYEIDGNGDVVGDDYVALRYWTAVPRVGEIISMGPTIDGDLVVKSVCWGTSEDSRGAGSLSVTIYAEKESVSQEESADFKAGYDKGWEEAEAEYNSALNASSQEESWRSEE